MECKRLFTPITIHGMTLKNRLIMPAIHHLYTDNGHATPRFNEYYWRRAEGGPGMIIVGGCRFDDYGAPHSMMSLRTDDTIPGWQEFTAGMHARDCKVAVQLYHAGRYSHQKNVPEGKQALAPSAVYSKFTRETPKAMTTGEMKELIQNWAEGARRAKQAGFDAVEILGSAGYLICQFLSPLTNLRQDEYGGCWENRCRFPLEVVSAVRAAVGKEYPLIMRIAGNDFVPGSNTNIESVEFAKLLETAGIDMLNVTGGWHETIIPQLPGEVPRGGFTYLAAAIKAAVGIPVMACNRINDPIVAEETLALGRADLIGVGRTLIADPDWCNKARSGELDLIRHCVACNQGCLAKTFFDQPVECLVNGTAGREYLIKDTETTAPKNLLVIGGGPGGCEFAARASRLGHTVTLWEKSARLGGQLHLVAVPPSKGEFLHLIEYYEAMLKASDVAVELCREGTAENIEAAGFDAVVVATGVIANTLSLPGNTEQITVCTAAEVLAGAVMPGKNVVVVGGGSVGCETAQYLARSGSISPEELFFLCSQKAETPDKINSLLNSTDRTVTIIEIAKRIGAGFELGTGWPIFKDLNRLGVAQHTLTKIIHIDGGKVIAEKRKDGETSTLEIPCDTIVLAVGSHPDNALYESLKTQLAHVYTIGDSNHVGKILDAIRDANELAARI